MRVWPQAWEERIQEPLHTVHALIHIQWLINEGNTPCLINERGVWYKYDVSRSYFPKLIVYYSMHRGLAEGVGWGISAQKISQQFFAQSGPFLAPCVGS